MPLPDDKVALVSGAGTFVFINSEAGLRATGKAGAVVEELVGRPA